MHLLLLCAGTFKVCYLSKLPRKDEITCIPQMCAQYGAVWMSYNSLMDPNAKSNTLGDHMVL